ncbi:hypothetical protein BFU36_06170 [Sulfolobus sp. A20]|uniref:hypothetical protein n=1 Tax=Sulfolobaceae TaxID=118883 RepID=UPI000845D930|nr:MULTISPECIES: hypothetical protein [unclassified Sulfolobus]TRM76843.1 hypothetical protein DJ523_00315 [Sulfolobus sp. E5]TRM77251.1 hypothetical protein DJ532_05165 [Sulfolobus sp. A20-N-F8]TRM84258.1 hypothetical protein DJ531_00910 [Sulfolobus sp. A20-N-F6]TRM87207.1 hypothetical protein DJ521_04000 [Sulfolobus sp. E3]TRN04743.1 hypothetical protein DJ530_00695 [Sulfolobus sp. E1]
MNAKEFVVIVLLFFLISVISDFNISHANSNTYTFNINYVQYYIRDSKIFLSYSLENRSIVQSELISSNFTTTFTGFLNLSYFSNNWTLSINTNLPNIFAVVLQGKYVIWSGFETNGISLMLPIPYLNQLRITIIVANVPAVISINETILPGESESFPLQLINLHNFIIKNISVKGFLSYNLPQFDKPTYAIFPFNYTYVPVTIYNSTSYVVEIIKGINGVPVAQLSMIYDNGITIYTYNKSGYYVYPYVKKLGYFVITNEGVETPFSVLGSLYTPNYSLVIFNTTYGSVIQNDTITIFPIDPLNSNLTLTFIIINNIPRIGLINYFTHKGIYLLKGKFDVIDTSSIFIDGYTFFYISKPSNYVLLSRNLGFNINSLALIYSLLISSILVIVALLLMRLNRSS